MAQVLLEGGAEADLEEAVHYYESIGRDLAAGFLDAFEEAVALIARMPHAWSYYLRSHSVRFVKVHHFPYLLIYVVDDSIVTILAVAHERRRPFYWRN